MKWKIFLVVAITGLLFACSEPYQATDTGAIRVSRSMHRTFIDQYPNATNELWSYYDPNVVILNDWELSGFSPVDESDYVVRFNMDNQDYYAWYDGDGNWIGTAYVVNDYAMLPSVVNTSIHNAYPEYAITNVNREFHSNAAYYEITMKGDKAKVVLLVDDNGVILKQKTKTND